MRLKVTGLNKYLLSIYYVLVPELGAGYMEIHQIAWVPALMALSWENTSEMSVTARNTEYRTG